MNLHKAFLTLSGKLPVDDPAVKARLDRAYDIVRMPGYELTESEAGVWQVEKASTSAFDSTPSSYTIVEGCCDCPDGATARAGLCKHVLASQLLTIMREE